MKLFQFDIKQLALSGLAGIAISIIISITNDIGLLLSISKSALIGLIIGLLIQITYKVLGSKIKSTMLWTNVVVCLNIAVVIIGLNIINGNTDLQSIFVGVGVSLFAGVTVVFFQYRNYKKANERLEERKLVQIERNKKAE